MKEATSSKIFEIGYQQVIDACLDYASTKDINFAFWKNPNSEEVNLIVDQGDVLKLTEVDLETLESGFLFSPFDKSKNKLFIKKALYIKWNNDSIQVEGETERYFPLINHIKSYGHSNRATFKIIETPDESEDFKSLVTKSVLEIKSDNFSKVVPSRSRQIKYEGSFNYGQYFGELVKNYPSAFISLTYTSESGVWIGASPELLISVENEIFKTVALAGTQLYNENESLADIAWTQKEIEEQALVSRYIINCFKKIRLREFSEHGPKTVKAGNLIHLKTDFSVNMKETNFLELGTTMLNLLHPTSAVCGMPLQESEAFLLENEGYDREFYSGFLGPVHIDNKTAQYVNLRCFKIDDNQFTFYAGAGVTEDSNPEKEWIETELKMNTLLNVIKTV